MSKKTNENPIPIKRPLSNSAFSSATKSQLELINTLGTLTVTVNCILFVTSMEWSGT